MPADQALLTDRPLDERYARDQEQLHEHPVGTGQSGRTAEEYGPTSRGPQGAPGLRLEGQAERHPEPESHCGGRQVDQPLTTSAGRAAVTRHERSGTSGFPRRDAHRDGACEATAVRS